MIAILEKYEHNTNFHQIVDFVEASHLRYALTINPTVYVSHIRQFWSTARVETLDEETKILATVDGKPITISESSIRRNLKLRDEAGISSLPDADLFENLTLMGVNSPSFSGRTVPLFPLMLVTMGEGSRTPTEPHHTPTPEATLSPQHELSSSSLPHSLALPTVADEPASPLGDDSQGEACPTVSGFEAEHDRENILKTSALPSDSTPRVTSFDQDEMVSKITAQDLEISQLKARIKILEDKDGGGDDPSEEDAIIKGRSLEIGRTHYLNKWSSIECSTCCRGSHSKYSPADEVPTGSSMVSTASPIFTTANVTTPYSRRKGKEKMVESKMPKKKKLKEQMDVQMARQLEEEMEKDAQRMNEQIARDAEIARIHVEEELQMLIDGLDRNNETVAKYLQEYEQFAIKDFIPIGSKEEGERFKRKGLRLEQDSAKKVKTVEEVSGEDLKIMMQLVPVEEHFDREDLNQLWALVKETLGIRPATSDKEKELWVELKRLFKPDVEDQLWTHTQALIHNPVEWRLYDSCGVHHVLSGDQEIFMLVKRDYPLRKGIAIVMISNKLQVENYSE
nr:hypothetical protein [Tanacetum cinerariifolium]